MINNLSLDFISKLNDSIIIILIDLMLNDNDSKNIRTC